MKDEKKVRYISQGISAPVEWWDELDQAAEELGLNPGGRSRLVREAVEMYLKAGGLPERPEMATTAA